MAIRRSIRVHPHAWTLLLLAAGLLLLVGAGVNAYHHDRGAPPSPFHRAPARDLNRVAPWMTVRYVSRSYNVPESVCLQALNLEPSQARGHTLAGIARLQDVPTRTVLDRVRGAIREYRASGQSRTTPAHQPAP